MVGVIGIERLSVLGAGGGALRIGFWVGGRLVGFVCSGLRFRFCADVVLPVPKGFLYR